MLQFQAPRSLITPEHWKDQVMSPLIDPHRICLRLVWPYLGPRDHEVLSSIFCYLPALNLDSGIPNFKRRLAKLRHSTGRRLSLGWDNYSYGLIYQSICFPSPDELRVGDMLCLAGNSTLIGLFLHYIADDSGPNYCRVIFFPSDGEFKRPSLEYRFNYSRPLTSMHGAKDSLFCSLPCSRTDGFHIFDGSFFMTDNSFVIFHHSLVIQGSLSAPLIRVSRIYSLIPPSVCCPGGRFRPGVTFADFFLVLHSCRNRKLTFFVNLLFLEATANATARFSESAYILLSPSRFVGVRSASISPSLLLVDYSGTTNLSCYSRLDGSRLWQLCGPSVPSVSRLACCTPSIFFTVQLRGRLMIKAFHIDGGGLLHDCCLRPRRSTIRDADAVCVVPLTGSGRISACFLLIVRIGMRFHFKGIAAYFDLFRCCFVKVSFPHFGLPLNDLSDFSLMNGHFLVYGHGSQRHILGDLLQPLARFPLPRSFIQPSSSLRVSEFPAYWIICCPHLRDRVRHLLTSRDSFVTVPFGVVPHPVVVSGLLIYWISFPASTGSKHPRIRVHTF